MAKNISLSLLFLILAFLGQTNQCLAQESVFRTAKETAKDMYPGWNLGNTLEATGGETSWQGTITTQALIDYVKSLGFRSVRIPCAWHIYMDEERKIDPEWMARVKEVVDYCIKDSLYVVLNDHWDCGWIEVEGFSKSQIEYVPVEENDILEKEEILKDMWTQIATCFKDYDEHLIFAGQNEPFQEYSLFTNKHRELTPVLLRYNQIFVDAVRATGGNNIKRNIVVQGPSTLIDSTVKYFEMPKDVDDQTGHIFAEVHFYDPWGFTGGVEYYYWGNNQSWLTEDAHYATYCPNENDVSEQFQKLYNTFVQNDIPVIIGEYSANWRDLEQEEDLSQEQHNNSVSAYYTAVNKYAVNCGIVTFAWDINITERNGVSGISTIIDRENLQVFNKIAYNAILEGTKEGVWPY